MATVTKTIGSGKDHATVALWESNVGNFGSDIYKGVISTNDEFNETFTLNGGTGTPSVTTYLWLTTDDANKHAGVAGTGHGRIRGDSNGSTVIIIDAPWTRLSWLDIQQDSTGTSDEGIRINVDKDDALISYCLVWTDKSISQQDGIYTGDWDLANLRIDNSFVYGWERSGLVYQNWNNLTTATITGAVDHCGFWDNGVAAENQSAAILMYSKNSSSVHTVTIYNTWAADTLVNAPLVDGGGGAQPESPVGTVTWNGSNLCLDDTTDHMQGTDNVTSWQDATDGIITTTKTTGNWIVVNSLTGGSVDLLLLDEAAGNKPASNGTDRIGSEPDARQDFSVDITGGTRPTTNVDIGPHQFNPSAPETGTASGTGSGTGTAAGTHLGTATGTGSGTGAATGLPTHKATASGTGSGAGAATGVPTHKGTATGAGVGTGAATGANAGTASATGSGVGAATGLPTHKGTASGTGVGVGAATGTHLGTAAGTGSGAGAATGNKVTPTGTASGTGVGVGAATGLPTHKGTGVGTGVGVGAATGLPTRKGTATGAGVGTGAATGTVVAAETGTAVGVGGGTGMASGRIRTPDTPPMSFRSITQFRTASIHRNTRKPRVR